MAKNYTNPLDEYYDLIGKQAGQQTSSDPLEEYYRLVSGDTTAKQLEQNAAGGMLDAISGELGTEVSEQIGGGTSDGDVDGHGQDKWDE